MLQMSELMQTLRVSDTEWSIWEIITYIGQNALRDGTQGQHVFRQYLERLQVSRLQAHAEQALTGDPKRKGPIIQEIANEAGRRIGFGVEHGPHRGSKARIGYDGLWHCKAGTLVVEVKTSETYNIKLPIIREYAEAVFANSKNLSHRPNQLLVLGTEDTFSLEAQIRGSGYADEMRVVGLSALLKAAALVGDVDTPLFGESIRQSLFPRNNIRVDAILELVLNLRKEFKLHQKSESLENRNSQEGLGPSFRDIDIFHQSLVDTLSEVVGKPLRVMANVRYMDLSGNTAYVILESTNENSIYKFRLSQHQLNFLERSEKGYLILGLFEKKTYLSISIDKLREMLRSINISGDARMPIWLLDVFLSEKGASIYLHKTSAYVVLEEEKIASDI